MSGYRLHELHLYNWGAFAGRHQASIDAANTATVIELIREAVTS